MTKTCRGCGREFAGGELFCPDDGSRLSSYSQARDIENGGDPLVGLTLDGRYRIRRAIGEGGMGIVYEAEHVLIEKRVAVKVLRESFTRRPDVVERFRQEARSASRIGHPNIVDVFDFGETPARASYIVMEMLEGEDLADILSRECALSPLRAAHIGYQIAKALAAAHDKHIIHRDLKPENIYLTSREGQPDFVKVVDFGVAKMSDIETLGGRKLTRTGMIFGTPEYMSPEHAGGKSLDHRVDIYALGVMLFELLTGRVPFEGDNFMEILAKHGHDPVPPLRDVNPGTRVSEAFEKVVYRALEKDPQRRYQTMAELAADLLQVPEMPRVSAPEGMRPPQWAIAAPPPPPPTRSLEPVETTSKRRVSTLRELARDKRVRWAALAALSLAGASGGLLAVRGPEPRTVVASPAPPLHGEIAARTRAVALPAQDARPAGTEPAATLAIVDAAPERRTQDVIFEGTQASAADGDDDEAAGVDDLPRVELRVRTHPAGANVRIEGLGVVCQTTPCTLKVRRGDELTLLATRGRASASRTLTVDDAAEVELRLPPPASPTKAAARAPARGPGDLKVPAFIRTPTSSGTR